jgi:hypothetical protein
MEEFPPPPPPYDRALALACRLRTFESLWLRCICPHHTRMVPIRMLCSNPALAQSSLADVVMRLQCDECHQRPLTIALQNSALCGPSAHYPDVWILPLSGAQTQNGGPEVSPEAASSFFE